jgi:hypothetical protein
LGRRSLIAAALAGAALLPATAHAGTYDVYSCAFGGNLYPNNAWVADGGYAGAPNGTVDTQCGTAAGDVISGALNPGISFAALGWAGLTLIPPGGTTISDFTVQVRHRYVDDTSDGTANNTAGLFRYGEGFFSGIGNLRAGDAAVLAPEGHWWGNGASPTDVTVTLSRRDSPSAMSLKGTEMILSSDCGNVAPCNMGPNDVQLEQILGSRITIDDPVVPSVTAVADGQGLLAPGLRAGDEPITFSATDNTGIRRAEIVDVTDAAHPVVVASEDYDGATKTDAGSRCDYTRPRPCPDVRDEKIAASPAVGGHRTLVVRVTDAGGATAVSAPFGVVARGPLNGVGGGDGARMSAGFPARVYRGKGKKRRRVYVLRPTHLVSFGKAVTMRGILRNAAGQPIAGADVRILVREDRLGAGYVDRGGVTTGTDGRFRLQLPKGSSRLVRLGYRAFNGDDAFASRVNAHLNVRARISVRGPRHIRPRGRATFTGRLVGRPFPPRGVTLDLQIFQPGRGWRVFGNARTRRNGRFVARYRFNSAGSGRFTFRLRLRPNDAYPYARGFSRRMRVRVG